MGHISLAPDLRHFAVCTAAWLEGGSCYDTCFKKSAGDGKKLCHIFCDTHFKNNFEELNFDSYRLGTLPPFFPRTKIDDIRLLNGGCTRVLF